MRIVTATILLIFCSACALPIAPSAVQDPRTVRLEKDAVAVWDEFKIRYSDASAVRLYVQIHSSLGPHYWRVTANDSGQAVMDRPDITSFRWVLTEGRVRAAGQGDYAGEDLPGGVDYTSALTTVMTQPWLLEQTPLSDTDPDAVWVGGSTRFRVALGSDRQAIVGFHHHTLRGVSIERGGSRITAGVLQEVMDPDVPQGFYGPTTPVPTQAELDEFRAAQDAPYRAGEELDVTLVWTNIGPRTADTVEIELDIAKFPFGGANADPSCRMVGQPYVGDSPGATVE